MNKQLLFQQFPHLESCGILLKKVDLADAEDLYEILTNENLFKYRTGNPLKNLAAVKNVIGHYERDFNKHKTIYLGIYLSAGNNKLVGIAEIYDFDYKAERVEIGYTVNDNYWGKGIATKATALMLDFLFDIIGVNSIQASVMPANEKSKKVLERCSFTHDGTLRQAKHWTGKGIVDLDIYSILKSERKPT